MFLSMIKASKSKRPSIIWFLPSASASSVTSTFVTSDVINFFQSLQDSCISSVQNTLHLSSILICPSGLHVNFTFFFPPWKPFPSPVVDLCPCCKLHALLPLWHWKFYILIIYWVSPGQKACLSLSMLYAWFLGQCLKDEDTVNICRRSGYRSKLCCLLALWLRYIH